MRLYEWLLAAAVLLAFSIASARRADQDFEFDDDSDPASSSTSRDSNVAHSRRPRRYIYDPHNSLCHSLVCKKREVCLLRDAFTALCATKKDIIRKGDVIVTATANSWEAPARDREDDEEDVFYDSAARDTDADLDNDENKPDRCVGCPVRGRGEFLCGSDNRTYSSLCRLDLHNCVHRNKKPVTLACRGFCPCPSTPRRNRRPHQRQRPTRRNFNEYDDDWRRRKMESSHNEVLPERTSRRRQSQATEGCALDKMANRLLDWFSVLMDEAAEKAPSEEGFPNDCKPEVRWMFAHLDTDGDGILSADNLYSLRHDERERCLRPFLSSCGGAGGDVTRAAWCACLRRAARPCTALARAHPQPHAGAYVPSCDARGFYRPRQCHAALGVCWCVDAHGVELPGSRTKGAPACPGEKPSENDSNNSSEDADGAPADDEDADGSGDQEMRF
ncbi:proteoglycan Cow [Bombyx mori]|uniref:Proteoglycan Cow n=1 Tax=Bombyx mori TaxID=7091 RepID=A0A8R2CA66_BOMMO|nr:proteoglycan Cow isoform X1 [Bombyx mori]